MAEAAPSEVNERNKLNLVAIGRTGDGKSSTLNSILAHSSLAATFVPFEANDDVQSVTKEYSYREADVFGLNCRFIDTMGLFDTEVTPDSDMKHSGAFNYVPNMDDDHKQVLKQLAQIIQKFADGVDAFLFVVSGVGRFTKETKDTIKIILRFFGNSMLDHCIFVLTKKDQMNTEEKVHRAKQAVSSFLVKCGCVAPRDAQLVAFDNHTNPRPVDQVEELIGAIQSLQQRHHGQPYQNAAFIVAQDEQKKLKAEMEREMQAQMNEAVAKITQPFKEEYERNQKQLQAREKAMKSESEAARKESQLAIDQLKAKMQLDKEQAERDKQEAIVKIQKEVKQANEIRRLEAELKVQEKVAENLRTQLQAKNEGCTIL